MTANLRYALWALLGLAVFLNIQAWMREYPAAPPAAPASNAPPEPLDATVPAAAPAPGATAPAATAPVSPSTALPAMQAEPSAGVVHVVTDVLDLDVSLEGGELTRADLIRYPMVKDRPDQPVRLLNRDNPTSLFVLQSGLTGAALPSHLAHYAASSTEWRLAPGQEELSVPLSWQSGQGLSVTKTLTFRRGQYGIGVRYHIANATAEAISFSPYAQLLRNNPPVERSYFNVESNAFKGPAYWDGKRYRKLKLGSADTHLDEDVHGGWIAAMQHHFVAAIVPNGTPSSHYLLRTQGNQFLLVATAAPQDLAAGASADVTETFFVGPKLQDQLKLAAPGLERVADYGYLTTLAQPLFWLLDKIHRLFGNWGFTIIAVTFLLKLLFYPLSEASGRSMAKMKTLGPRIKTLQESYKDDREKLGRAMMELYQREKVNPLAGCLPMLIQIPVFLAFYWVLLESVEMRQAPFVGWITDLSSRDPYFILPAIMAGAMFVQYKLNPQMGDPMQQKIFMIMPLAMSVMFAFFPAGLVLYWVTNTLLSILQQWNINRRILGQAAKARQ